MTWGVSPFILEINPSLSQQLAVWSKDLILLMICANEKVDSTAFFTALKTNNSAALGMAVFIQEVVAQEAGLRCPLTCYLGGWWLILSLWSRISFSSKSSSTMSRFPGHIPGHPMASGHQSAQFDSWSQRHEIRRAFAHVCCFCVLFTWIKALVGKYKHWKTLNYAKLAMKALILDKQKWEYHSLKFLYWEYPVNPVSTCHGTTYSFWTISYCLYACFSPNFHTILYSLTINFANNVYDNLPQWLY